MKKVIKKNYKFILGVIIGLVWSSGIAYAATILFDSDEVSYDNTTSGLSATNVQSALDELYVESTSYQLFETRVTKLESLYSVGSIYISTDSTNPTTLFGGKWQRIEGKFLLGATVGGTTGTNIMSDASVESGSTGGEAAHTLTVAELAKHTHTYSDYYAVSAGVGRNVVAYTSGSLSNGATNIAGNDQPHNNMPPFLSVYIWKRTA